jgi:hypothetical protein
MNVGKAFQVNLVERMPRENNKCAKLSLRQSVATFKNVKSKTYFATCVIS